MYSSKFSLFFRVHFPTNGSIVVVAIRLTHADTRFPNADASSVCFLRPSLRKDHIFEACSDT